MFIGEGQGLWIGYNDLNGGATAATVYTNLTTFIGYVHGLGGKVLLANEVEVSSSYTAALASLQALILANTAGADAIANFANDPVWLGGTTGTYGYTSQTFGTFPHPSTFGYGYVANDFANALNMTFH